MGKQKSKQLPKVIWAAGINLSGYWGPFKLELNHDDETSWWFNMKHDVDVQVLGLDEKENRGWVTFSSLSREEVELWVSGVKSVMAMLRQYCYVSNS